MSIEHFNSIFGFTVCHELPINDLIKVNRVCKKWRSISNGYIDQAFQSCLMQLIRSNAFEQRYNKKAKEDLETHLNRPQAYQYLLKKKVSLLMELFDFDRANSQQDKWKKELTVLSTLNLTAGQAFLRSLVNERIYQFSILIKEQLQTDKFSQFKDFSHLNQLVDIKKNDEKSVLEWIDMKISALKNSSHDLRELSSFFKPLKLKPLLLHQQPKKLQFSSQIQPMLEITLEKELFLKYGLEISLVDEENQNVPQGVINENVFVPTKTGICFPFMRLSRTLAPETRYRIVFKGPLQSISTRSFTVVSEGGLVSRIKNLVLNSLKGAAISFHAPF